MCHVMWLGLGPCAMAVAFGLVFGCCLVVLLSRPRPRAARVCRAALWTVSDCGVCGAPEKNKQQYTMLALGTVATLYIPTLPQTTKKTIM